jgi:hypothetical protein
LTPIWLFPNFDTALAVKAKCVVEHNLHRNGFLQPGLPCLPGYIPS